MQSIKITLKNKGIKKVLSFLFISMILLNTGLFALEVDIDELKSAEKVEFQNYTGKNKIVNLVNQIKGIGRDLARSIKKKGKNKRVDYNGKYSMIHSVSKEEPDKLSADIFSIDKKARVDHIKNVRRIIAGYLETRYNYSPKHANTLALFLSYYNAVYCGYMDYFTLKYKKNTLKNINADNVGISTKYNDWPDKTKFIIPLTEESKRGQLDTIDPFIIADDKVKTVIRIDDEALDERKDMVKIMEKIIEEDKKDLEKARLEGADNKIIKKLDEEIKAKEEEIEKEKERIREDELKKKEKDLDKREDLIRSEKVDKNIFGKKLYYLKVIKYLSGGHYYNEMYAIDTSTHEIKEKSPLKSICGSKYDVFSEGVVVITYKGKHKTAHRLTLLDKDTLKVIKHSKDYIFWRSFVIIKDNSIYVIIIQNKKYYLGKFDKDLKLTAQSKEPIHGDTFISFFENHIYINRWDKNILALNKNDLSLIDIVEPGVQ